MKRSIVRGGVCPLCGKPYTGVPALDRRDNQTAICPDCGTRQALESIGVGPEEQEQILRIIHDHIRCVDESPRMEPCPFCGSVPDLDDVRSEIGRGEERVYYVECSVCGARTAGNALLSTAIETWNDRRHEGEETCGG